MASEVETREVEIRAPAEQTEGTRSQILRWLKSIGEQVTENEPLIEIETDKVTVEVASPGSGMLREIFKQAQEEIEPGDLLGRIEGTGLTTALDGRIAVAGGGAPGLATPGPTADGPLSAATQRARERGGVGHDGPAPAAGNLSPAVRRLLAERGLDASQVRGTGQGGRVTVQDVLEHVGSAAAQSSAGLSGAQPRAALDAASAVAVARPSHQIPHSATRKRIAEHMVQSLLHTAPHVTTVFEADLTAVLEHRQRNKDDFARRGAPLTLTAYFLQAAVAAIRAVPEVNSRWTDTALEVFDFIHIGVATALDTGLVVPVLRDVQSRDLFETAQGLEDLVSRAREGRLSPADVRGGTFTLSNHGVSGSLIATPIIINQPQAAILGIGKLEKRPVVLSDDGEDRIVVRPRSYVTLTIDHRAMDGHQANRFLQTFLERLATSPW
jgi:2-oxoglutarate dehydrogenase E2 component (dihydrolipoamide succinyltransferase)